MIPVGESLALVRWGLRPSKGQSVFAITALSDAGVTAVAAGGAVAVLQAATNSSARAAWLGRFKTASMMTPNLLGNRKALEIHRPVAM